MTITCGIQPTGTLTMAMEVLHNTCNMYICNLSNMNAVIPQASGIHIRQIPYAYTLKVIVTFNMGMRDLPDYLQHGYERFACNAHLKPKG